MRASMWFALLLAGCPKPAEPEAPSPAPAAAPATVARPAPLPDPLPEREFKLPEITSRKLSNGLEVMVATNTEVPLWDVRLVFDVGGFADPAAKEGLASVTLDMMNEGAAGLSAEDISRELKRLGASITSGANEDRAVIGASGPKRHLEATLDLWAKVVLQPDFPEADWLILQKQRLADLANAKENPDGIATRVLLRAFYGDAYRGRLANEAAYKKITVADMKKFRATWLGPQNAIVLAGGALTADEIVPLLEARLGAWKPDGIQDSKPTVTLPDSPRPVVYLADKPDAAQTVVRVVTDAGRPTDPGWHDLSIATAAMGTFTGRMNLNLRESKGITYGASCTTLYRHGPAMWYCGTAVQTDATGVALDEIRKELTAAITERPFSDDEIGYQRSSAVLGFPGEFERTGAILDARTDVWLYGLPDDWVESYVPRTSAVTTASANEAYAKHVVPDRLTWVVVGDKARIAPDIEKLGFRIIEVDRDGRAVAAKKGK